MLALYVRRGNITWPKRSFYYSFIDGVSVLFKTSEIPRHNFFSIFEFDVIRRFVWICSVYWFDIKVHYILQSVADLIRILIAIF